MDFFGLGSDSSWDAHQACVDMADEVGSATNTMYDVIGIGAGLGPFADAAGDYVGSFVQDGWGNGVCEMAFGDSDDSSSSSDSSE